MGFGDILLRLGVATLLGLLLGYDREVKDKPLGLRTYMLVSVGSACFAMIADELIRNGWSTSNTLSIDPTRVIQGIVSGVGFIGAGAIIQAQKSINGAATGAGIWVAGGVGIACGFELYTIGISVAVVAFIALTFVEWISNKLSGK